MPLFVFVVDRVIWALSVLLIVSSILSWFQPDPRNPLVRLLHAVVDPLLLPVRAVLPPTGGMDFSPMVVMIILWILRGMLARAVL
ncbi:MAG: YggT family protein [Holophagaceae bacterium]